MGARVSVSDEAKARSNAIDRQIEEESRNRRQVNMLLLGTYPDRSMIVKQMKVQHGLTKDELTHYRLIVYRNTLDSAQALARAIRDVGIEYTDPMNHVKADRILDYHVQNNSSFVFSREISEDIHQIWQDPIMQTVMDRRNEFWLGESAEYFFKGILRIGSPDYLPTDSDILQARENLSLILETRFTFGTLQMTIIDTARKHSVKKWMHFFEDLPYIIFCASLSDYDQFLEDSNRQNRLGESIILFESVVNSRWFMRTSVILLLNNADVFKDKLSKIPLTECFPEYTGGSDVDEAIKFIKRRFMQFNRNGLPIYVIRHPANNATTAQSIFEIIKHAIQEDSWKDTRRSPSHSTAI